LTRARERGDAGGVAAYPETAIAAEIAVAVEHRKPGQFDSKARIAAVRRHGDGDAAPSVARGEGALDLAFGIETEGSRDLAPGAAERGHGVRPEQSQELLGVEGEAAVEVHLPNETQRLAPLVRGRR
jgi:hypothetical protein